MLPEGRHFYLQRAEELREQQNKNVAERSDSILAEPISPLGIIENNPSLSAS
jgi:hypothetical protein